MKLQTQIPLKRQENQIDYDSKVLLMGSCFAQNIGEKLAYFKFQNLSNPFGIVFHPIAIEKLVTRALDGKMYAKEDLFYHNSKWHCFEAHSVLSRSNETEFVNLLNEALEQLGQYLISASHIIFTYGTAWVYRYNETNSIVSNCHKVPQKLFAKELMSVNAISESIANTVALIQSKNSKATVIATVSPVRHIRDGLVENSRSKAHLLSGLHDCVDNRSQLSYFPAYELMLDELRDYRFYAEDMLHPTTTAISIIWERFQSTWISSNTEELQKEIDSIQKGLLHRPFDSEGEDYDKFKNVLQKKIIEIQKKYPEIRF